MISTLSVTEERAKVIDFSYPYTAVRAVLVAPKSIDIRSLADLDGKTVGTTRGSTHDTYLTQNVKNSKIVRYEDDATAAQAVVSGQIEIFTTGEFLVPSIAQKIPDRQLEVKWCCRPLKRRRPQGREPVVIRGERLGEDQYPEWQAERDLQEIPRRRLARGRREGEPVARSRSPVPAYFRRDFRNQRSHASCRTAQGTR